jgi:hypothetical protein
LLLSHRLQVRARPLIEEIDEEQEKAIVEQHQQRMEEEEEEEEDEENERKEEEKQVVEKAKEELLVRLREQLLVRMTQLYEFEDVRKLAAEVVAFLPPKLTLPAISQSLLRHVEEAALVHVKVPFSHSVSCVSCVCVVRVCRVLTLIVNVKVDIYAICNALLVHGKAAHPFVIDLVPAVLSLLKLPIPSSSTGTRSPIIFHSTLASPRTRTRT